MPEVEYSREFARRLHAKSPEMQGRILHAIETLAENPRNPGLHGKKIKSAEGVFEARIDGGNRMTWEWINDGVIRLRTNCHHDQVLKNP